MQPYEVALCKGEADYPTLEPYHPDNVFPEHVSLREKAESVNHAYGIVRNALLLLGLDKARFGQPDWNPLGELINPGDHVLIKPNFISQSHSTRLDEWEQVITHPAVIRAVLDYVFIALQGRGKVTIADGPQTDSDFDEIVRRTRLLEVVSFFRDKGLHIDLLDLRPEHWLQKDGITYRRETLHGDPAGYVNVSLDDYSEFGSYRLSGRFYGADWGMAETRMYHSNGRHAYVLSRTAMEADVVINIPKMKTHKKTGVTLSLKNMVGINGNRNCLPHHTIGTPTQQGDEFPTSDFAHALQSGAITAFKRFMHLKGSLGGPGSRAITKIGRLIFGDTDRVVRSGNWFGNDTAWRMVLDLNKALFHFDASGGRRKAPLRYLTIVDGIVAGEGNGPVSVDEKRVGLIVAGFNPVAVDTVCAAIMGFDYRKIPLLANAWLIRDLPLAEFPVENVRSLSNVAGWTGSFDDLQAAPHLAFRPFFGWKGHIERPSPV